MGTVNLSFGGGGLNPAGYGIIRKPLIKENLPSQIDDKQGNDSLQNKLEPYFEVMLKDLGILGVLENETLRVSLSNSFTSYLEAKYGAITPDKLTEEQVTGSLNEYMSYLRQIYAESHDNDNQLSTMSVEDFAELINKMDEFIKNNKSTLFSGQQTNNNNNKKYSEIS